MATHNHVQEQWSHGVLNLSEEISFIAIRMYILMKLVDFKKNIEI